MQETRWCALPCEHLHERSAHQARLGARAVPGKLRSVMRWSAWSSRSVRQSKPSSPATVWPSAWNVLRTLLFLSARLCQRCTSQRRRALGCRIDGGQAGTSCRMPIRSDCHSRRVSDRQALLPAMYCAAGCWQPEFRIGRATPCLSRAGPTVSAMLCAMLHHPHRIIICDPDPMRLRFVREHYRMCDHHA